MTPKIEHCQLLPSVCPPTECSYEASVVAARTAIFWGYQHPFWFRGICVSLKWDLFGYLKKSYIVNSELFFFFFYIWRSFPFYFSFDQHIETMFYWGKKGCPSASGLCYLFFLNWTGGFVYFSSKWTAEFVLGKIRSKFRSLANIFLWVILIPFLLCMDEDL